jgi:hypothetical protein
MTTETRLPPLRAKRQALPTFPMASLLGFVHLFGAIQFEVRVPGQQAKDASNQAHDGQGEDAGRIEFTLMCDIDVHEYREQPKEATLGHTTEEFVEEPDMVVRILPRDTPYPNDAQKAAQGADR